MLPVAFKFLKVSEERRKKQTESGQVDCVPLPLSFYEPKNSVALHKTGHNTKNVRVFASPELKYYKPSTKS